MELLSTACSVPHLPADATVLPTTILAALRAPASLPPGLQSLLFETQWAWWIGLLAAALAIVFAGRVRESRPLKLGGIALLAAAILWFTLATLCTTPRERLQAAHNAIADASGKREIETILTYLHDDFRSPAIGIGKDAKPADEIRQRLDTYGIKENRITSFKSEILPNHTESITRIVVLTTTALGPVRTTWELEWVDVPSADWRIAYARLLAVGDNQVSESQLIPR